MKKKLAIVFCSLVLSSLVSINATEQISDLVVNCGNGNVINVHITTPVSFEVADEVAVYIIDNYC